MPVTKNLNIWSFPFELSALPAGLVTTRRSYYALFPKASEGLVIVMMTRFNELRLASGVGARLLFAGQPLLSRAPRCQGQSTTMLNTNTDHLLFSLFCISTPKLTVHVYCPACAWGWYYFGRRRVKVALVRITNWCGMLHWPTSRLVSHMPRTNWLFQNYLQPLTIFTF